MGAICLLAVSGWWLLAILARYTHWLSAAGDLSTRLHPILMIYGFFPFFIFGFAFTAGPRWLQMPAPATRDYLLAGGGMGAAFLSLFATMFTGDAGVALSLSLYLICAAALWWRFSRLVGRSRVPDKVHARLAQISLAVGGLTLLVAIFGIAGDREWRGTVRSAGLWGFLVPLFCTVCHRMLPFFTASALDGRFMWRPWWLLGILVGGAWMHGLLEILGLGRWLWLIDGPLAVACFHLTWRWGLVQSLGNRLLAMLHLSFVWLAIGYALSFVQAQAAFAGTSILGLGPLHAISIGFLASLAIAMVTRVTCGHSGRTLAADRVTWALFVVFQLAAVSRVAAETFGTHYADYILLTSAIWFGCFSVWVWRNAPTYLAARTDGMPG